ncbi:MAG: SDR family NAD(P)-dependent oxidoreductase [Paracoccaceae bacterium]|nr:SDR family NAD(P)-dependent oxidoreductase [Paracoccaceae bacterium]MDG1369386.1 SDR family NAD(P)-dependent oxidoreductase [Paracoccaceae bacterium]MDG1973215.1 SDR family NAD(P)-dependent oxidoreductase [Paracoccaceae bacterium]
MIKSVLITGGGSGIGAALAVALAKRNCEVIISGRRPENLMSVARQSSRITPHSADVTNADDQDALAEAFSKLPSPRARCFTAQGTSSLASSTRCLQKTGAVRSIRM